jgi:regulator of replication initiation timing
MKSLAEQVLDLEGKYRLLCTSIEEVSNSLDIFSEDNPLLKIVADQLKEILKSHVPIN